MDNSIFSKKIEEICSTITLVDSDYDWCTQELKRLEGLTQDYLHKLEIEYPDYSERAKIATKLAKCRRERRAVKDRLEVLARLKTVLDSELGKELKKKLPMVLGETRKVEKRMKTRGYTYRELKENN